MSYLHYELGNLSSDDVVEVTLDGNSANVRLMDSTNFSSYRSGRNCTFYGGLAKMSPVRIAVPHSGFWHVAIDMNGLGGSTNASVRVI